MLNRDEPSDVAYYKPIFRVIFLMALAESDYKVALLPAREIAKKTVPVWSQEMVRFVSYPLEVCASSIVMAGFFASEGTTLIDMSLIALYESLLMPFNVTCTLAAFC